MNSKVLVVDDDHKIQELIRFTLESAGYELHTASTGAEAVSVCRTENPDLVLLDIRLPDTDGMQVLDTLRLSFPEMPVIMISAHGTIRMALAAVRRGASDFIEKPFDVEELELKVEKHFETLRLREEVRDLRFELGEKYAAKQLVGGSAAMKDVFEKIRVAAGCDAHVLIRGESGTGKEMVARAIHFGGDRKLEPFVGVNCAAIPSNLLESELFGHEKGAFTGALQRRTGKFEHAAGGSLFLDEIGDLSAELQVKLLRVIQEREIERIGGHNPVTVRARFIFATNRNLDEMVADGRFREDLFYRMNVLELRIPPLRERPEDLDHLVNYFIRQYAPKRFSGARVSEDAMDKLRSYSWPGNIRELENVLERSLLLLPEGARTIEAGHIRLGRSSAEKPAPESRPEPPSLKLNDHERAAIEQALKEAGGNFSRAARELHISRDTLYRKVKKYGIGRK